MQGNERVFDELSVLFDIIEKQKISDKDLYGRAKLVLAFANTMKGDFGASLEMLTNVASLLGLNELEPDKIDIEKSEDINNYNFIFALNKLLLKDYEDLRQDLFEWATFAQNSGNEFYKNLFKVFLGKILCDSKQARRALEIYDEQISYFADKKLAIGALLCWYLIAEATIIASSTHEAIDVAQRALDIAQNPAINNYFFNVSLKLLLAKAYMKDADYESANMNLESALAMSQKYGMNDLTSKVYLVYARYYQELSTADSPNRPDYLKGAKTMYERAMNVVVNQTRSVYMKETIEENQRQFEQFCSLNGFNL